MSARILIGLRRALQEAGAESVLMSMWSVPDRETQALREAQSELGGTVKARYGRDLRYYWGAFVLVDR